MISNVANENRSVDIGVVSSSKNEVDDNFIAMLTEKFSNDDIPDAYQSRLGLSISDMCNASSILGIDVEDHSMSVMDIQRSVKQDLESFSNMLGVALDEAGISRTPNFEIKWDATGKLYIDSDHPDKESIEKILNETPNICNTFKRMSSNSSMIAAIQRAEKFNKEYALDPKAAVQKYSYLFDSEPCDAFSVFVSEDECKPSLNTYGEDVDWDNLVNPKNNELQAL